MIYSGVNGCRFLDFPGLWRIRRFREEYGLSEEQAELVADEKAEADYFEEAVAAAAARGLEKSAAGQRICHWLLSDIRHIMIREGIPIAAIGTLKLSPQRLAALVALSAGGQVSGKNAKQAAELVLSTGRDPEDIIREQGWERITDPAQIAGVVQAVYAEEEKVFAEVRSALAGGRDKRGQTLKAYLVGRVLERTGGRADPRIAESRIEELIAGG
jgi:aspartyl-tRNA(Asn)/glutamyl-tRNA(Gln) amidotransferase subunit B